MALYAWGRQVLRLRNKTSGFRGLGCGLGAFLFRKVSDLKGLGFRAWGMRLGFSE